MNGEAVMTATTTAKAEAPKGDRPLRMLQVVHAPWDERLGMTRVSIELGRVFASCGHTVEHYCITDSDPPEGKVGRYFQFANFQRKAAAFIRAAGGRYDVIQAEQGVLPMSKRRLGHRGLMIAKSNGLAHFYREYANEVEPGLKRRSGRRDSVVGRSLKEAGWWAQGGLSAVERSFASADQIHLLNRHEVERVSAMGHGGKVVHTPNGLDAGWAAELAAVNTPGRAESDEIVFVGTWNLRKGQVELPAILREVRRLRPEARLKMLGTFSPAEEILPAFDEADRGSIQVVANYDPSGLPALLAGARVGLMPSHIEGFPLAVLEMSAAGVPVVAWDVPGPGALLDAVDGSLLTTPRSVEAIAAGVARVMAMDSGAYLALSRKSLETAGGFTWRRLGLGVLSEIERGLDALKEDGR